MRQKQALDILKTGANVFLTGSPGSGKTHTIQAYIDWLRSHDIEPAITASTGVAATHLHGTTIHAWSGIGITEHFSPYEIDRIASKEPVAKRMQKAPVLIIDEVSMLSAPVLDAVDLVCQQVRGTDQPFGGMQVVFVGDFFQLPPIGKRGQTPQFAFHSRAWQDLHLVTCYLTEQHRQDDDQYLRLLETIRSGEFSDDEAELLRERMTTIEEITEEIPRLYTHNADVDKLNDLQLAGLPGKTHIYMMEGQGRELLVEALKRGCLSPEKLTLKEGAMVMCTKNNAGLGYANGTIGQVTDFDSESGNPIITTLDGREILITPAEWVVEEDGKIRARIMQVPLRLAWAITIHKSQGQSLDAAAMDLSRAFEFGQGYVALSRVKNLEGLHLLGWSSQALAIHPFVTKKDHEFQEASETAEEMFEELEEMDERAMLEKNFIEASGGTLEVIDVEQKKTISPRQTTYEETLALIVEKKSIEEIAKVRALNTGTIADHIEKLSASGRITKEVFDELVPDGFVELLPDIERAFDSHGYDRLTPVFKNLDERYTYDELKLARAYLRNFG